MFFECTCKYLNWTFDFLTIWKVSLNTWKYMNFFGNNFFFSPQYWCGEHFNVHIICQWNIFHIEIHPQPPKTNIVFWDTFGLLFQVQMTILCTIVFEKLTRRKLQVSMRKSKSSIWFEMLKEGKKFWNLYFLVLQIKTR